MPDLTPEDLLHLGSDEVAELPPRRVLALIQDLFRHWGLFGRELPLWHEGEEYCAWCQETVFVVYRRVAPAAVPHGAPGWPVLLVSSEAILDECTPPLEEKDHFACHLGLADWLTLIQQGYAATEVAEAN